MFQFFSPLLAFGTTCALSIGGYPYLAIGFMLAYFGFEALREYKRHRRESALLQALYAQWKHDDDLGNDDPWQDRDNQDQ